MNASGMALSELSQAWIPKTLKLNKVQSLYKRVCVTCALYAHIGDSAGTLLGLRLRDLEYHSSATGRGTRRGTQ